jgi:small subunit ribosomal protein S6
LNTYETVFITVPTLPEDAEKDTVDGLAGVIDEMGGTIHAKDRMGRRRLAYPIRKFEDGVYTRFLYDSGIDVPRELERRMRLSENVLRMLTVRLERDWAVDAKAAAVRDAKARAEAAAAAAEEEKRKAAEAAAAAEAKAEEAKEEPAGEEDASAVSEAASAADGPESAAPETSAESAAETTDDAAEKA